MTTAAMRLGVIARDLRLALGLTQRELALRADVSQAWVCAIERGRAPDVGIGTVEDLFAVMGARLVLDVAAPFLVEPRQRDPAHGRCVAHVARRLERSGWRVATEVEIGGDRSRGWIDVLAWHPGSGLVLVIEVKTEIRDLGAIERAIHWYEREAWAAARRLGWRPRGVVGCLVLLSTDVVDRRIGENRELVGRSFPLRSSALSDLVESGRVGGNLPRGAMGLALIDPRSRRRGWLRATRLDGRRTPAPYADYIDFLRRVS